MFHVVSHFTLCCCCFLQFFFSFSNLNVKSFCWAHIRSTWSRPIAQITNRHWLHFIFFFKYLIFCLCFHYLIAINRLFLFAKCFVLFFHYYFLLLSLNFRRISFISKTWGIFTSLRIILNRTRIKHEYYFIYFILSPLTCCQCFFLRFLIFCCLLFVSPNFFLSSHWILCRLAID